MERRPAARKSLGEIIGGVRDNAAHIKETAALVGDASDQMAAATGQIANAVGEVTTSSVGLAKLSQESAQEIEAVAAGSEDLVRSGPGWKGPRHAGKGDR